MCVYTCVCMYIFICVCVSVCLYVHHVWAGLWVSSNSVKVSVSNLKIQPYWIHTYVYAYTYTQCIDYYIQCTIGHTYKINSIIELDDDRVGNTYTMVGGDDKTDNDELPEIVSVYKQLCNLCVMYFPVNVSNCFCLLRVVQLMCEQFTIISLVVYVKLLTVNWLCN